MQNIQLSSTLKQNLSHLSEIKKSEMLGCIIFTKEILEYAEATTGQSDLPEEQARVIEQVCPLIGENSFQYMEGESIRLLNSERQPSPTLSQEELFCVGYRNSLLQFTEKAHEIIKGSQFTGKKNAICQTFLTATGLTLSGKLEKYMSDDVLTAEAIRIGLNMAAN